MKQGFCNTEWNLESPELVKACWERRQAKCSDCGVVYGSEDWIECVVPHAYWLLISPTGDQGGLLCFACMRKRFAALGFGSKKRPVPFRVYYPGGPMRSELYLPFDGAGEEGDNERAWWMALKPEPAS